MLRVPRLRIGRPFATRRATTRATLGLGALLVALGGSVSVEPQDAAGAKGGSGKEIVRVAKKYKDAKYVWGEESPKTGFDCSGFTWFVVKKATGQDIGRVEDVQKTAGSKVANGKWRPGDLVFFKNTIPGDRGVSHVGIYIDNGKFIHAANEKDDVIISDIYSDYYQEHYAGARRL